MPAWWLPYVIAPQQFWWYFNSIWSFFRLILEPILCAISTGVIIYLMVLFCLRTLPSAQWDIMWSEGWSVEPFSHKFLQRIHMYPRSVAYTWLVIWIWMLLWIGNSLYLVLNLNSLNIFVYSLVYIPWWLV